MAIHFFSEECNYKWKKKSEIKTWLKSAAKNEGFKINEINFILCSDEVLLKMNVDFLNHDTLTDIITFDNSEKEKNLQADIFISIDRITENAHKFKVTLEEELSRIMIHGTLHLMGYKDKSKKDKEKMTAMENYYLARKNGK